MSKEIDWSKAPEGATHYLPETEVWFASWFKHDDGVWFSMLEHNDDKWDVDRDMDDSVICLIGKPVAWTGQGLPPVGTVCEVGGEKVVVVAHHCNGRHAIYAESEIDGLLYYGEPNEFRPIRTHEQIAAEEREKSLREIEEMIVGYGYAKCAELIYDAGYRKTEASK